MKFRKTVPGYIFWCIFAVFNALLVALLACDLPLFLTEDRVLSAILLAALCLVITGVIYFGLDKIARRIWAVKARNAKDEKENSGRKAQILEGTVLILLFAGALFFGMQGGEQVYWNSGTGSLLLFLCSALSLYFAVRIGLGAVAALLSCGYFLFCPFFLVAGDMAYEKAMMLAAFFLALFLEELYILLTQKGILTGKRWLLPAVVLGAFLGALVAMDAGMLLLLIPLLFLPIREDREAPSRIHNLILTFLCVAAGFLTAVILGGENGDILGALQQYESRFFYWNDGASIFAASDIFWPEMLLGAALFMAFGWFSYVKEKDREGILPWLMLAMAAILAGPALGESFLGTPGSFLLFMVMAGAGGLCIVCSPVREQEKEEELTPVREQEKEKELAPVREQDNKEEPQVTEIEAEPITSPSTENTEEERKYIPKGFVLPEETEEDGGEIRMNLQQNLGTEKLSLKKGADSAESHFDVELKSGDDFDI